MGRLAPDSLSYPHQAANVMPGGKIKAPGASAPGAITRTSWGNDKGLYATMIGGRIDPSSCLDTCWVDDMAVWWFRATCFHGLKYLCVNRMALHLPI